MIASLYLVRFQARRPTRLNLRAKAQPLVGETVSPASPGAAGSRSISVSAVAGDNDMARSAAGDGVSPVRPVFELAVMFNYNGHTFEAFEALGLPAGSSFVAAQAAHAHITRAMAQDSRLFYDLALQAISASHQRAS